MKRTGMMNIKDILRHHQDLALPRGQIAAAVAVRAGAVSHVLARADAAGLSWPLPSGLDVEALRALFYPTPDQDSDRVQPDWDAVIEELEAPRKQRRTRLTRRRLWVEYRNEALAQEREGLCRHRPCRSAACTRSKKRYGPWHCAWCQHRRPSEGPEAPPLAPPLRLRLRLLSRVNRCRIP